MTLAEKQALRDKLATALYSGAQTVETEQLRLTYRTPEQIQHALALLDADIAAEVATPPARLMLLSTSKGITA